MSNSRKDDPNLSSKRAPSTNGTSLANLRANLNRSTNLASSNTLAHLAFSATDSASRSLASTSFSSSFPNNFAASANFAPSTVPTPNRKFSPLANHAKVASLVRQTSSYVSTSKNTSVDNFSSSGHLATSPFPANLGSTLDFVSPTQYAKPAASPNYSSTLPSSAVINPTSCARLESSASAASFANVLNRNAIQPRRHTSDILTTLIMRHQSQAEREFNGLGNELAPRLISNENARLAPTDLYLTNLLNTAIPNAQISKERTQKLHPNQGTFLPQKEEDSLVPVDEFKRQSTAFPMKLYQILSDLEKTGRRDVASFLPSGRAFKIHKPDIFIQDIVPKYFQMTSFASFRRQLNMYGFKLITTGPDKGAYFHDYFVNGQPHLNSGIKRRKDKRVCPRKEETK